MSINIVLADTHSVFKAGVARLLAVEEDFRIIAQCDDSQRLMKAVDTWPTATFVFASVLFPDTAILPRKIYAEGGRTVAILENNEDPTHYLKQGTHGIVHRDVVTSDLVKCLRHVGRGGSYIQPRSTGCPKSLDDSLVGARTRSRLTAKELAIIGLLLQGYKNKDIAVELDNSEQVIKNYLRSIFDKTGVSDRLELALFAIHHKLLAEPNSDAVLRQATVAAFSNLPERSSSAA